MNPGPLFSFLFFFMLVLLAISSVCGGWEALVGSIMDEFPQLRTRRVLVMVVSCAVAFLIGFRNFPHPASIEDMPNNEINEIEDDQIMMGGEVMVSYDASLDQVR